jgi:hypothetical protein
MSGNPIWGEYPDHFEFREIVGDTVISGQKYYVHTTKLYDASFELTGATTELLRYDTTHSVVVAFVEYDSTAAEEPWPDPSLTCDLSADFYSDFSCYNCPDWCDVSTYGSHGVGTVFQIGELTSSTVKMFTRRGSGVGVGFVHGIGVILVDADFEQGYHREDTFARLDGVSYGRSEVIASTREKSSTQRRAIGLSLYPNPVSSMATVSYSLDGAQTLRLEVFDVVSRRVVNRDLGWQSAGLGSELVEFDLLSAGAYLVRLTSGLGEQAATVVVKQR